MACFESAPSRPEEWTAGVISTTTSPSAIEMRSADVHQRCRSRLGRRESPTSGSCRAQFEVLTSLAFVCLARATESPEVVEVAVFGDEQVIRFLTAATDRRPWRGILRVLEPTGR